MSKPFDQIKCLIVEDDEEKRIQLVRLLQKIGLSLKNVFMKAFAEDAIDCIKDEYPDVVLLDLKIPYNKDDSKIQINNSNKVIDAVKNINNARNTTNESTGVIIISASIDDRGLQNSYKKNQEIVAFIDKIELAQNPEKFQSDLKKQIGKIIERKFSEPCQIELKEIRLSQIKPLEKINTSLYNRLINDILTPLASLNNRNVNIHHVSKKIVTEAGIIVEDIINLSLDKKPSFTQNQGIEPYNSIRNKLNKLTGREWNSQIQGYSLVGEPLFSRKSAEYARLAYKLRSESAHSMEADNKNDKLFANETFTPEDAFIASSLIFPLVLEFIKLNQK